MDRETMKVESSVPVQGRVSIVTLAELEIYWASQGIKISSMSQLLSWSIDILRELLYSNEKLPKVIDLVTEAHNHLNRLGLYQQGLKKRSMKKIANAMTFENLRFEGVDPQQYVKKQYNTVHNSKSVRVPGGQGLHPDVGKMVKIYEEKEKKDREKKIEEDKVIGCNHSNCIKEDETVVVKEGMSEEEFNDTSTEREENVRKRENAPIDMDFLKKSVVVK